MQFEPVQSQRLYQLIATQIAQRIKDGEWRPGDRLPSEAEMARQFGVSRPTVREAMIALDAAGLVHVQNGNGIFVREPGKQEPRSLGTLGETGPSPFEQFEAREVIECEIAARAAQRITPEAISELERALDNTRIEDPGDPYGDRDNYLFVSLLARHCGNGVLQAITEDLWRMREGPMWKTMRRRVVRVEDRKEAIALRRRLVQALRDADPKAARAAMQQMFNHARSRYFG